MSSVVLGKGGTAPMWHGLASMRVAHDGAYYMERMEKRKSHSPQVYTRLCRALRSPIH